MQAVKRRGINAAAQTADVVNHALDIGRTIKLPAALGLPAVIVAFTTKEPGRFGHVSSPLPAGARRLSQTRRHARGLVCCAHPVYRFRLRSLCAIWPRNIFSMTNTCCDSPTA